MKVQHPQYPFYHTVVYEVFDQQELALLKAEARRLELDKPPMASDPHHKKLREERATSTIAGVYKACWRCPRVYQ